MPHLLAGAAAASTIGASTIGAGSAFLGGWGAAGLSTAASAAAGAGVFGGLTSTVLTILSGAATAASVLGTLQSAESDSFQATANASQADLEAGQSQLQSEQRQTTMKRELVKVLGENTVAFASAGIDLNGGIADSSAADAKRATERQLSIERADDENRRALLKARANGYRTQAASYKAGGILQALGQTAQYGADVLQRG